MRALLPIFLISFLSINLKADEQKNIPEYLQDISCTVKIKSGSGSGTLIGRGNRTFVITATHVVEKACQIKEEIICMILLRDKNREEIGRKEYVAKIMCYSCAEEGEDICILLLKQKNLKQKPVKFYVAANPPFPRVGTAVWHCGTLLGTYPQSIIQGRIAAVGCWQDGTLYDQLDIGTYSGCSGGGIFNKKGEYIGMLDCGTGERGGSCHWFVPIRRMKEWAKERKLDWLFDSSLKMPSSRELRNIPLEDD